MASTIIDSYRFYLVRREATTYLESHRALYVHAGFGPRAELGTFQEYLRRMQKDGAWAVGPIVDATAQSLKLHIQIIDFRQDKPTHFVHINEPITPVEKAENRTVCIYREREKSGACSITACFCKSQVTLPMLSPFNCI